MKNVEKITGLEETIDDVLELLTLVPEEDPSVPSLLRHAIVGRLNKLQTKAQAAERFISSQSEEICHLREVATTDPLTQILNRRGFENEMRKSLSRAERSGEVGVLLYIDLDGFKSINDCHGHAAGDEVLRSVASHLSQFVRDTDVLARVGGDEFAMVLTGMPIGIGRERAINLEEVLNNIVVEWEGQSIAVGASVGLQAYGMGDFLEALLDGADRNMYSAKQKRSNPQISAYPVPTTRSFATAAPAQILTAANAD